MTRPAVLQPRNYVAPVEPYRAWRDLRVVAPARLRPGVITFITWPPRHLAWVTELDPMPSGVADAIDHLHTTLGETYQPDPAIPNLPSLQAEHRREWGKGHKGLVDQAVVDVVMAVRAAAPDLYRECGQRMARAIGDRDDHAYTQAATLAAHLRGSLGHVEGTPPGSRRAQRLTPGAPEWVLGRPDVWFEDPDTYKPRLTASWLADHPEVEPGCYTPAEVVANLTGLRP